PASTLSAGTELPRRVSAHRFLCNRGEKMRKPAGNVIDPFELAEKYGLDAMRYYFLREVSFGQDGSYNHEAIVNRINADLANDLGNLAQRSLSMVAKNCGGQVPTPGAFTAEDQAILDAADALLELSRKAMDDQAIRQMLNAIWQVVGDANRYFAVQEPWALRKADPARMATVLYVTIEVVRQVAILAQPVMPESCEKLLDLLGLHAEARAFEQLGSYGRLVPGTPLPAPEGVFPRYVEKDESAA